ncbi:MAG: permease-like cell division protein FtsX [Bacteroidales bacterium]|nr:permease-like cell division protein FtsX [Lentimicrobiaceae bacterium]MDD5694352.1 permease-like cell division protein FtsX [Bacteroidales bacterium]
MSIREEQYNRRRIRSSYITTLVSITMVLFMLGLLGLLLLQAERLSRHVKENISLSVIMNENVKEASILEFQKKLDISSFVKYTEYIPKEKAAADLKEQLGEDFISFLGYNPLLPSIDVHLKAAYANNDSIPLIEQQLIKNTDVKEVFYQKSLVDLVNANTRRLSYLLTGLSLLLLLIAIALINNTIRLSVYAKRFLLRTMQLVGATQGFIRKPFVRRGIVQGLIGGVIASLLLLAVLWWAQREIPEMNALNDPKLLLSLLGIVILTGIVLTWISTYLAVRKYLKIRTDELYY